jgi:LysR family glycine cleavage system transcriptional activator
VRTSKHARWTIKADSRSNLTRRDAERLLPLNALRMFAAVGRLLSFSRAAQELHVTASAVSHQIRTLEEYLGIPLLRRNGSHIELTAEGKSYLPQVLEGLAQLSRATRALKSAKDERVLRVACPPNLSALWLIRRIGRFADAHPGVGLALIASRALVDLHKGEYDLAIRYGKGAHEGFHCDLLSPNEIFPVCSPRLLKGPHPLRAPDDLRHHTLLDCSDDEYHDGANPGWLGWLEAAGLNHAAPAKYFNFSPRFLMQQAVVQGLGVGLSRTLLAADFLESRQLVCPFGPVITLSSWYYLVCPEATASRPEIEAFRAWLLKEAHESQSNLRVPG